MSNITWGDTVRITACASPERRPGALAAVCGIAEVRTEEHARTVGCEVGTTVFLIEFTDGGSVEVAAEWLEKVDDDSAEGV